MNCQSSSIQEHLAPLHQIHLTLMRIPFFLSSVASPELAVKLPSTTNELSHGTSKMTMVFVVLSPQRHILSARQEFVYFRLKSIFKKTRNLQIILIFAAGTSLTLECGTTLYFPIQHSSLYAYHADRINA